MLFCGHLSNKKICLRHSQIMDNNMSKTIHKILCDDSDAFIWQNNEYKIYSALRNRDLHHAYGYFIAYEWKLLVKILIWKIHMCHYNNFLSFSK